jgi:hypothetical protein
LIGVPPGALPDDEAVTGCDELSTAGALSLSAAAEAAAAFRPREVGLAAVFAAFFVAFFAVVFVAFFAVPRVARLRFAGASCVALSGSCSLRVATMLGALSDSAGAEGFAAADVSTTPIERSSGGTSVGRPPGRPPRERIPRRSDAAPAALRAA